MASFRYNQFHALLLQYAARALSLIEPHSQASKNAVWALVNGKKMIGLTLPSNFAIIEPTRKKTASDDEADEEIWTEGIRVKRHQRMLEYLEKSRAAIETTGTKALQFFDNLNFFQKQADLDDDDAKILTFYTVVKRVHFMSHIFNGIRDFADEDDYFRAMESLIDITADRIKEKIFNLAHYGLIEIHNTADFQKYQDCLAADAFKISDHFADKLLVHMNKETLLDSLIGERAKGELTLEDFSYMEGHARHLIEVVRGAANDPKRKNKNFGVYGVPGVGKTKFMAVIEHETGIPVYFVGSVARQSDKGLLASFKEPKRSESLGDLLRASFIAKRLGIKVILVKDEAEGILTIATQQADKEDTSNKSFINNFLDNNETPIIYITNDLDALQLATKRRLVSWTAFRQPPTKARAEILAKQIRQHKLVLTDDFIRHLAEEFPDLSPGVTAKILLDIASREDVPALSPEKIKAIILDQFQQQELALNDGFNFAVLPKKQTVQPSPLLWAADIDLDKLGEQLNAAQQGFLLTLAGPYGSGKKTFAYTLANQMGRPLTEKSASDIPFGDSKFFDEFSNFVETAKLDNGVMLLSAQNHLAGTAFTYDHFLRLIQQAKVPTILTIDGPSDAISLPAKLIGASFEVVYFHYLSPVQSMLAYHHFFGRPSPAVMQTFKTLTPSIFANLKSVMEQTGVVLSDEEIVEKLHRRAGEYKKTGLVRIDKIIGYSGNPENEIEKSIPMDYRGNGMALMQRRGVRLTLEDRYNLLDKVPKQDRLKWKDIARLIPPERNGRSVLLVEAASVPKFH